MEICVGEYVRFKNGLISKVTECRYAEDYKKQFEPDNRLMPYQKDKYWLDNKGGCVTDINIIKHSKNIIDLIEDEDIVVLEYKTPKYRERIQRKFIVSKIDDFINFENRHCDFTYKVGNKKIVDKICKNIKIKQILTAEQFNTRCYRLEENKC